MKTSDITLTIIIFIIFILLYVFNILSVGIKQVSEDWPKYRCNPTIMPFASVFGHDPVSNFTYCIQNMQSNYMGYLMQPLQYNFSVLGGIGGTMTKSINDVRAFINNIVVPLSKNMLETPEKKVIKIDWQNNQFLFD